MKTKIIVAYVSLSIINKGSVLINPSQINYEKKETFFNISIKNKMKNK